MMYRSWIAPGSNAILLLVHGLGAHSERWNFLAKYLTNKGISSYALELSGFGETPQARGHIDSFKLYYRDIEKLYAEIKKTHPDKKVFLLGESLGGLLAFIFSALNQSLFAGLILISPAFKNGMKFTLLERLKIFSALAYHPSKTFNLPFTSSMCTRDKSYQKKMDEDPRELRIASAKLLFNTLLAQGRGQKLVPSLKLPTLFLISGKDSLVDANESKKVFDKLKLEDKTLIEYPEMLHALSIDLDREKVFDYISSWILKRV